MHRDQMSEITVLPGTNRNGKREGFDQNNHPPLGTPSRSSADGVGEIGIHK